MFKVTRSTTTPDQKEILKYPQAPHAKSVVLDAQRFTFADDGLRHIVPAGTILKLNATGVTTWYEEYKGSGTIQGILAHEVDIAASSTAGAEPVAMYWAYAIFATTSIVGFTQYASALVSALPTCKFE